MDVVSWLANSERNLLTEARARISKLEEENARLRAWLDDEIAHQREREAVSEFEEKLKHYYCANKLSAARRVLNETGGEG